MNGLTPKDQRFIERSRRTLRKGLLGVVIILISLAAPIMITVWVEEAGEQYFVHLMNEAEVRVKAIGTTTSLEADLKKQLLRSFEGGRTLAYALRMTFRIAMLYFAGSGMVAGFSLFISSYRDRRYLRIVDQLARTSQA